MRFKLHFNDKLQQMDINCLHDNNNDTILPDDPSQHVYYPIPKELRHKIRKSLLEIIDPETTKEFIELGKEIKELTNRRRDMMNNLREELNPKIMEQCEKFKSENAEFFI